MDDRRGDGGAPAGEDGGFKGAVVVLLMLEGIAALFFFGVLSVYLVRRGGTSRALLGHSIGALLLVPGWLALGAMWLFVTGELSA